VVKSRIQVDTISDAAACSESQHCAVRPGHAMLPRMLPSSSRSARKLEGFKSTDVTTTVLSARLGRRMRARAAGPGPAAGPESARDRHGDRAGVTESTGSLAEAGQSSAARRRALAVSLAGAQTVGPSGSARRASDSETSSSLRAAAAPARGPPAMRGCDPTGRDGRVR
jgi:hypothetical protein